MAQSGGRSGRARGGSGKRATDAGRTVPHTLPADLAGALRHLDDAQLDRLRNAVTAETRRRGRRDGKTSERGAGRRPIPVTPGQERSVLAAFESGSSRRRSPGSFASRAPRWSQWSRRRSRAGDEGRTVSVTGTRDRKREMNARPQRCGGRPSWRSLRTDPDYVADWRANAGPVVQEAPPFPLRRQTVEDLESAFKCTSSMR